MTLDEAIRKNKGELKAIIFEFEKELNNKDFKTIYDNIDDAYVVPAFTALLLKNNINPLEYMNKMPSYFAYDLYIESFEVPNGITNIGDSAFQTSVLKSIVIPKSVIYIDNAAFCGCDRLKDIYYEGSKEDWGDIKIDWGNNALLKANIHYNS